MRNSVKKVGKAWHRRAAQCRCQPHAGSRSPEFQRRAAIIGPTALRYDVDLKIEESDHVCNRKKYA